MQKALTRRSLQLGIVAAACGMGLIGGAWAASPAKGLVAVQHAKGTTEVPAAPKRVVVFDLGSLDTLQTLGVPVAGVPKAQFPEYMAGYGDAKYTVAGSLFEPNYEVLSQIKPDLIIVGGRSAAKYDILSKIAPTVDFSVKGSQLVSDVKRNVTELSKLYGKQAQGAALTGKIDQHLANLRNAASRAEPGVLLMGINERIMPQAPGSRFGFLFDEFGVKSQLTAKDLPARGGPAFTFDNLAALNPQWIYVIDRNTAVGSAAGGGAIIPSTKVFDNEKVKSTPAGQKGQVVFLDPKGWYLMGSSGPTALLGNMQQLEQVYTKAGK